MNSLDAVLGNPRLKLHFIVYIGLRHMQRFAPHYPDVDTVYGPGTEGAYYAAMREGAYADLKEALKEEAGLHSTDDGFQSILQAAIQAIVSSVGMESIVRDTRDHLWWIEGHDSSTLPPDPYYPRPERCLCGTCGTARIPLGPEDLSEELVRAYLEVGSEMEMSWFCLRCRSISNE